MTAAAPSGVVTFLFTDVEGSTRRWEAAAKDCITSTGKGSSKRIDIPWLTPTLYG